MLPKKFRIERQNIAYILKKGEEDRSKLFIIRHIKTDKGFNRYCTIVSRKIDTSAVNRNRLRRQIYEAIRGCEAKRSTSTKKHNKSYDIVLIPKKNITSKNFGEIETDIRGIIKIHG